MFATCGASPVRAATEVMQMTDGVVLRHRAGRAAYLTINRPEQRNALSNEVLAELRAGLAEAKADRGVRAVVLAGAGDRAFCAGGDLSQMGEDGDELDAHRGRAGLAGVLRDLWELGKPTIARVQGYALAGGFGLAAACDFLVASDRAVFGVPEVGVGLWPYMITVPLLQSMAPKDALRLMLTGRRITAAEGARLGVVSDLVEHGNLDKTVAALVEELAQASPQAVSLGRTTFYSVLNHDVDARLRMLEASLTVNLGLGDAREGLSAFAGKRKPAWQEEHVTAGESRPPAWGRWGPDDERGALNRVTPQATQRGLAAARSGTVVSLAVPLAAGQGPIAGRRAPLQHFMVRDGGDYAAGLPEKGFGFADDCLVLSTHGNTHLDALAHVWQDHQMWNGHSADLVTSRGARRCGIDRAGPIVTRGLFVDFAGPGGPSQHDGHAISAEELRRAVEATGCTPEPGDALLIRTGWLARWRSGAATELRWAGLHPGCADWIDEQGFALVGADNIAVEAGPSADPADAAPLHVALIRDRGIYLMELADLEELAGTGRAEFLLVVSPLPLVGGAGSPVNPVAIL